MNATALVQLQLDHNAWATRQIIDAARPLPPGAVDTELGIGPGPLRATVEHIIEAMFFFASNFAGTEYQEPSDFQSKSKSLDGLTELLERSAQELNRSMLSLVERAGAGAAVAWPTSHHGSLPAFAAIAQVFDHGSHHRAQCKNMLKRLGVADLPETDPLSMEDLRKARSQA